MQRRSLQALLVLSLLLLVACGSGGTSTIAPTKSASLSPTTGVPQRPRWLSRPQRRRPTTISSGGRLSWVSRRLRRRT